MALSALSPRQASFRPAACRTRTVRVAAVHQPHASAFVASAAAALLLCSHVVAVPLSPVMPELASNPVKKALNKLDSLDPPVGVAGPEIEGYRSNPDKARALAAENSPAGSPEAEAKGASLLGSSSMP